ncbi:hypothetical protein MIZ01_2250 [Sideroxyarcus emersonii]|uniref:Uncharacterized protein n=1 Tax=Sideroxyarcus emersonii TaxID=2764705 RepID=A0AAN2BZU9_9PROT|nr:hypothetical protein [Sideroxyarcus emersonii]BCK88446.1 hypothetical protein MIZ01_2250 [Sideroxyarcus emersonii]
MNKPLSALIVAVLAAVSMSASAADAAQAGAKKEPAANAKHATMKHHHATATKAKKGAAKDAPKT